MAFYTRTADGRIRGRVGGTLALALPPASSQPIDTGTTGVAIFSASFENADTIPTWAEQELSFGETFVEGDIPAGYRLRAVVDGQPIPCQVSNRTTWDDGSLKVAKLRALVPAIPVGGIKAVTWERVPGDWSTHDAPLHPSPTAITSKVALEYSFPSWKGRNASDVLTEERGPKVFRAADMLASGNAPWIDAVMAGPICCEWRASDMAALAGGGKDLNFGAFLYARAWGGTPGNPRRIQFWWRTVQGWSTDMPADEQGLQVDAAVKVNGSTIRAWTGIKTWKGGFLASAGDTGLMDWYDVQSGQWVTPPKLIYRRNIAYGVRSRFVPPYDTSNPAFPMTAGTMTYTPGKRGPLRPIQDDVGDSAMISWTTAKPAAWAIAAHTRATAAQIVGHQQYARSAALGMGAMHGIGLHRTTRKIISYLPPSKQTNEAALGTSIYGAGRPANSSADLRPEIKNLDAAHFPQLTYWTVLSEGDQHMLDLAYTEATLPGLFESDAYGFKGNSTVAGTTVPFGGISYKGQIRAVTHCARPMGNALALGDPSDPHWTMCRDYVNHWWEMVQRVTLEEDNWRGGLNRTDGRRFQDLRLLWPNNEPTYKIWMQVLGLGAIAMNAAASQNATLREAALWLAHAPTVMAGGYHNDSGPEYYLMKPDPIEAAGYLNICMNGLTDSVENRRYWYFGQWRGFASPVTFKADGQTCDWTDATGGMSNGIVVSISGVRSSNEPLWVSDATKVPGGIEKGRPYYTVQASGQTTKLSETVGGPPITFDVGGADMVSQAVRSPVGGVHAMKTGSSVSVDANNYIIMVLAALDMVQHYIAPNDPRILLARTKLWALKNTSAAPNAWDERGKTTVPRTMPAATGAFSPGFSSAFS